MKYILIQIYLTVLEDFKYSIDCSRFVHIIIDIILKLLYMPILITLIYLCAHCIMVISGNTIYTRN